MIIPEFQYSNWGEAPNLMCQFLSIANMDIYNFRFYHIAVIKIHAATFRVSYLLR
jgi:hypothetical protein